MAKQKGALPGSQPGKPSSLFILGEDHFIRRYAGSVIEWKWFEYAVLLAIVANCVVLALDEHLPDRDRAPLSLMLETSEPYFVGIFCVEATLKIVALGFFLHRGSYLRNVWNIIDFIVVLTGIANYVIEGSEYKNVGFRMLRSFRVLRPLKLVSKTPSLQVVLESIFKSMIPLSQIGLLVLFTILIFAIVGLHFYEGALHNTCYLLPDKLGIKLESDENETPCTMMEPSLAPQGAYICPNTSVCRSGWTGPNNGITSFDNIFLAMLTVFQCITMEGWTSILYWTNDALGSTYNWIYFVPLIIIGSFVMLNLVMVVLAQEFAKERECCESRRKFIKFRNDQRINNELWGYVEWIYKGEEVMLADEQTPEEVKMHIIEVRRLRGLKRKRRRSNSTDGEDDDEDIVWRHSFWRHVEGFFLRFSRKAVHRGVKSQVFYWFVILVVFLNTVCVALEHNGQPPFLTDFLCLFVCEMLMKIYALGVKVYFNSIFNRFDCIVILGAIFELIWFELKGDSYGFSVVRSLRLIRIFKLTKYWSSLGNLLRSLLNSMRSIISLLFLLFLFLLVFALLGMQLFGGAFNYDDGTPAANFDTFSIALMTVFQIITVEDWNKVMYNAIESQGGIHHGGLIYSIYFIVLLIFGRYTLLNVFLAIAVDNLASAQDMSALEEEAEQKRKWEEQELNRTWGVRKCEEEGEESEESEESEENENWLEYELTMVPVKRRRTEEEEEDREKKKKTALGKGRKRKRTKYSSMFIFSPANPIRRSAHHITSLRYFDAFIITIISASTVALALENPVEESADIIVYFDCVFTGVFTIEMLLKLIDRGVFLHPGSYFRDLWNILDSIVVICTLSAIAVRCPVVQLYVEQLLVDSSSSTKNVVEYTLSVIASLRIVRVLLLLKIIKHIPKLNAVFDWVVASFKNVFVILITYLLFFFIFAVIAVRLFNGRFHYCNDESRLTEEECKGRFFVFTSQNDLPVVHNRTWERRQFHFDNVVSAMLTLFTVQTHEGWTTILQHSMDSVYKGHGPLPHFRIEVSIFYVVFFIVFPFFFVNIFVALIIITFHSMGEKELEEGELDKNQKSCIDFSIQAKPLQRYMPKDEHSLKYAIWRMVIPTTFEYATMALTVLNTILLMMKSNQQTNEHKYILHYTNLTFTALFAIECLLKITAFGLRNFFKDSWNTFDFLTVCGTVLDALVIERRLLALKDFNFSFFRLFRLVRLIKLIQQSSTIRSMLWTFLRSFKELPYVCLLIAMLFSVYAIVGMQAFGNIDLNANSAINRHNNFQTFFQALLLLFRCSTGENWQMMMLSCRSGRPCDPKARSKDGSANSCGSDIAYVYFVSFIFFCTFLMLNLFIAVIMDNFNYLTRDWSILGVHHLDEFILAWSEYDPNGTGYIHYTQMYDILMKIAPPLGLGNKCPKMVTYKKLIRMNMPLTADGKVNFTSTLFALIRENLNIKYRQAEEMDQADRELRHTLTELWPLQPKEMFDKLVPPNMELRNGKLTIGKIYGGLLLLDNWKATKWQTGFRLPGRRRSASNLLSHLTRSVRFELESPPETDQTIPTPPTIVIHPAVSSSDSFESTVVDLTSTSGDSEVTLVKQPFSPMTTTRRISRRLMSASSADTSSLFNRAPKDLYELVETIKAGSVQIQSREVEHLTRPTACLFCMSPDHYALHCDAPISDEDKLEAIFRNKLCWRCLMPDHHTRECYTKAMCSICQRSHNTIVHSVASLSTIGLSDAQLQIIQDAQQVLPPTGKDSVVIFRPCRR